MFFKLGLIVGAALTVGLISLALIVDSEDQPTDAAGEQPSQQEPADPTDGQVTDVVQPIDSAKDDQENTPIEQDPGLLIVWSDQQQDRLTVSLQIDAPDITDCQFRLLTGSGSDELMALAKVMDTPSQRGCIGHFEGVGELSDPVQLVIEGSGSGSPISCRFDLRGEADGSGGRDLFWQSSTASCIGNFNS